MRDARPADATERAQSAKAPELSLRLRDAMVAATPSGMWSALPRFEGASFQVAEDSSSLVHFFVAASEQLRGVSLRPERVLALCRR